LQKPKARQELSAQYGQQTPHVNSETRGFLVIRTGRAAVIDSVPKGKIV
jgi:hypothetical protein